MNVPVNLKIVNLLSAIAKAFEIRTTEKYVLTMWYECTWFVCAWLVCTLKIPNITVVQNTTDFC